MTVTLKEFAGAAAKAYLSAGITNSSSSFSVDDASSFPTGSTAPFVICVDRGTSSEEKMLILSRASNALTVTTRGYDGTAAVSHVTGATVEHVLDATVIREANKAAVQTIGKITTAGDILVGTGSEAMKRLGLGSSRNRLAVNLAGIDLTYFAAPTFDVKEYGAVGDGVANDTAACTAAVDAAIAAGGGVVFFPKGTYLVTTINPSKAGAGLVTVVFKGAGMYASTIKVSASDYLIRCSANDKYAAQVIAEDLTLDGNYSGVASGSVAQPGSNAQALINLPAPNTTPTGNALNGLYHNYNRVRFYRPAGYAFQPVAGSILEACVFDSCGQPDLAFGGLHWDNLGSGGQADCIVNNCTWVNSSGNYADFVSAAGGGALRLTMVGCKSFNHQIGGVYGAGVGSVIVDNVLTNTNAGSGIGYDSSTDAAYRSKNIVTGNVLTNMTVNTSGLSFAGYGDLVWGNIASDAAFGVHFQQGTLLVPDGTVSAPGVRFGASTNTGLYRATGDVISFAATGNNILSVGPGVAATDADVNALNGILRLYSNTKIVSRVAHEHAAGVGFFGHAAPGAQPAAPVTLADVIAIIRGCGLSA